MKREQQSFAGDVTPGTIEKSRPVHTGNKIESPCSGCSKTWHTGEPPRDRHVVIQANLTCDEGGGSYWVEPICCEAWWNVEAGEWCFASNDLAIRQTPDDTLIIHHWIDLPREEAA